MYNTNWQGKLIALMLGIIVTLAALIVVLLANRPEPITNDYSAPAGMVQVVETPIPSCNALINALGRCK